MKTEKQTFDAFCEAHRIPRTWLESPDGHLTIDGNFKWLPTDELVVGGNLQIKDCDVKQLPPRVIVGGHLWIANCEFETFPAYIEVQGNVSVRTTHIVSVHQGCHFHKSVSFSNCNFRQLPDHFHVAGNLTLYCCPVAELPKDLVVDGSLTIIGTQIRVFPEDCVCRDLLAGGSRIEKLPENWRIHSLHLSRCPILELPKGLKVLEFLDISYTQIKTLPADSEIRGVLKAVGSALTSLQEQMVLNELDVFGSQIMQIPAGIISGRMYYNPEVQVDAYLFDDSIGIDVHPSGKYVYCEGILSEMLEHKGNVWRCRSIETEAEHFIITDGKGNYAHGDTIRSARADLQFKRDRRDTSKYADLQLDDSLSFEDAYSCYRTITGACRLGTEQFIRSLPEVKDSYTIREIIQLTIGQFGHETFCEFFLVA